MESEMVNRKNKSSEQLPEEKNKSTLSSKWHKKQIYSLW